MRYGSALVIAAGLLLGGEAAFAGEATLSLDGIAGVSAVGDQALSQRHGRDGQITIYDSAQSLQTLSQTNGNFGVFGGGISNGPITLEGGLNNFSGIGNVLMNSGNANNLGQMVSIAIILH